MDELVEFVRARLKEREKLATDLKQRWAVDGQFAATMVDPVLGPFSGSTQTRDAGFGLDVANLADPDWVLRDVEAKRRIVERAEFVGNHGPARDDTRALDMTVGAEHAMQDVLRFLASVYSDHRDYDAEKWRP